MIDYENLAKKYAKTIHTGMTRNDQKTPYIKHIIDVVDIVKDFDGNRYQVIAAYLHDTVEDGSNEKEIKEYIYNTFGRRVFDIVISLTRYKGIPYDTYIDTVVENEDAVLVKLADLISNMSDMPKENKKKHYKNSIIRIIKQYNTLE